MAIFGTRKDERIRVVVADVTLVISRCTSAERQKVMDKHANRGLIKERLVMDELIKKHVHDYLPDDEDPNTWIYDGPEMRPEYKVEREDFTPELILDWTEDVKADLYNLLHDNAAALVLTETRRNGRPRDRSGNLRIGSEASINQEG